MVVFVFVIVCVSWCVLCVVCVDKTRYRTFSRVVPPDAFLGDALFRVVAAHGWHRVAILKSQEDYPTSLAAQFVASASQANNSVEIVTIQTYPTGATDLAVQLLSLRAADVRIIIFIPTTQTDAVQVMNQAYHAGLTGKDYQWLGCDTCKEEKSHNYMRALVLHNTATPSHTRDCHPSGCDLLFC